MKQQGTLPRDRTLTKPTVKKQVSPYVLNVGDKIYVTRGNAYLEICVITRLIPPTQLRCRCPVRGLITVYIRDVILKEKKKSEQKVT